MITFKNPAVIIDVYRLVARRAARLRSRVVAVLRLSETSAQVHYKTLLSAC